jgi:hypothetical protein
MKARRAAEADVAVDGVLVAAPLLVVVALAAARVAVVLLEAAVASLVVARVAVAERQASAEAVRPAEAALVGSAAVADGADSKRARAGWSRGRIGVYSVCCGAPQRVIFVM